MYVDDADLDFFFLKGFLNKQQEWFNTDILPSSLPPIHPICSLLSQTPEFCVGGSEAGWRSSERVMEPKRQLTCTHQYTLGFTLWTCLASFSDACAPVESAMARWYKTICVPVRSCFILQWVDKQQHCTRRSANTLLSAIGCENPSPIKLY